MTVRSRNADPTYSRLVDFLLEKRVEKGAFCTNFSPTASEFLAFLSDLSLDFLTCAVL